MQEKNGQDRLNLFKRIIPQRNNLSLYMAYAKRVFLDVVTQISKLQVFRVNVENDKSEAIINRLLVELQDVKNSLKEISQIKIPDNTPKITESLSEGIEQLNETLESINSEIVELQNLQKDVVFPKVQEISGEVSVSNLNQNPQLEKVIQSLSILTKKISNEVKVLSFPSDPKLTKIILALENVKDAIQSIRLEVPPQKEIRIPEFPKMIQMAEGKSILATLESLENSIKELPRKIPQAEFPNRISVDNFPPQKYPLPVTNININPLRGFVKSRAVTVTTSLTTLPGEVLSYRRSIVVYNNSASTTVFIGGSDVTAAEGMPVPAGTYSPSIDAGPRMIVYGIVASGSADVRTIELSNENIGG